MTTLLSQCELVSLEAKSSARPGSNQWPFELQSKALPLSYPRVQTIFARRTNKPLEHTQQQHTHNNNKQQQTETTAERASTNNASHDTTQQSSTTNQRTTTYFKWDPYSHHHAQNSTPCFGNDIFNTRSRRDSTNNILYCSRRAFFYQLWPLPSPMQLRKSTS
jgi:hypothetical protein